MTTICRKFKRVELAPVHNMQCADSLVARYGWSNMMPRFLVVQVFLRGNGLKLQSWTKLVETNVKSSCKFKKWLTFFKKNSSLTSLYQCWIWPCFAAISLKHRKQHFTGGRGGFSQKIFFVKFVSTVLSGIVGNYNFWKYPTKLLKRITMHSDMLYALN